MATGLDHAKKIHDKIIDAVSVAPLRLQSEIIGWLIPMLNKELDRIDNIIKEGG